MRKFRIPANVRLIESGGEGVSGGEGDEPKSFTQEQVNEIVESRLAKERGKYKDYDELKAKAAKWQEAEDASKSEVDKLREANAALQKQIDDAAAAKQQAEWVSEVAKAKDVPAELLRGSTKEELEAHADQLHAVLHPGSKGAQVSHQTGEPSHQKGGKDADERNMLHELFPKD